MKRHLLILVLGLSGLALALAGCQPSSGTTTPKKRVEILAYINVTSGCQKATVEFLKSLPAKYPDVGVELVDFGDGDRGMERWHASGLRCMAININGASIVRFAVKGKTKEVAFQQPVGLNWTHVELEQAVQAALAGKLQPVVETEEPSHE